MHRARHSETFAKQPSGQRAARLLLQVFLGLAFVINAYLAPFFYPDNPLVGDVSAAVGALILAAPILWTALRDLIKGQVHMNELVTLAVLSNFGLGDFKTDVVISFFMLLSLIIETRTAEGAHASIESLIRLTPTTALRILEDGEEKVAAKDLREGDLIRVHPGDNIPADGRIVTGHTTLNESTITGESIPRDKGPDEEVFAGTQNLTGSIEVHVTRVGEDTTLGQVRDLILAAEESKLPIMRVMDRYAGYYTPTILMIAALVWFFTHDGSRVIALLVVACPCAIILATPTAMVAALSAAARLGILVKAVADLETASRISAVVFDKTGTLTTGELAVAQLAPIDGVTPSELLFAAGSADHYSHHPAATALVRLAKEAGQDLAIPEDLHEEHGQGVRARVENEPVLSGRASWLRNNGIQDAQLDQADGDSQKDYSKIFVARKGRYLGWIGLQDEPREHAALCLEALRAIPIERLAMVTGDRTSVAKRVAGEIGCHEFRAECLPSGKVDFVNEMRAQGYRIAVVGDGVNDAPALAAGDMGIAMGAAGSDVAIHSATVALMNNDLRRVPFLFRLSHRAQAVIYQNLGIGLAFIVGGLILSGLGYLNPIVAAILHNTGSLLVIFNSARLVRSGEELEQ